MGSKDPSREVQSLSKKWVHVKVDGIFKFSQWVHTKLDSILPSFSEICLVWFGFIRFTTLSRYLLGFSGLMCVIFSVFTGFY